MSGRKADAKTIPRVRGAGEGSAGGVSEGEAEGVKQAKTRRRSEIEQSVI